MHKRLSYPDKKNLATTIGDSVESIVSSWGFFEPNSDDPTDLMNSWYQIKGWLHVKNMLLKTRHYVHQGIIERSVSIKDTTFDSIQDNLQAGWQIAYFDTIENGFVQRVQYDQGPWKNFFNQYWLPLKQSDTSTGIRSFVWNDVSRFDGSSVDARIFEIGNNVELILRRHGTRVPSQDILDKYGASWQPVSFTHTIHDLTFERVIDIELNTRRIVLKGEEVYEDESCDGFNHQLCTYKSGSWESMIERLVPTDLHPLEGALVYIDEKLLPQDEHNIYFIID